jgi:cytoskeletal protein CcmA (bactofilin family)
LKTGLIMSQSEITETPKTDEAPASKAPPAVGKDTGASKKAAKIGPSIVIHGDVAGEEDLIVDGTIEGTVNFKENHLIVSKNGRVTANINARVIRVDGEVKGELRASEQVSISPSGQVNGDIRAPRVVLEDGCQFKGSVDMAVDKLAIGGDRSSAPRLRPSSTRPVRPGREKAETTQLRN